jgi:hypothetical protein
MDDLDEDATPRLIRGGTTQHVVIAPDLLGWLIGIDTDKIRSNPVNEGAAIPSVGGVCQKIPSSISEYWSAWPRAEDPPRMTAATCGLDA